MRKEKSEIEINESPVDGNVIEVSNLKKAFGPQPVLNNVSLTLKKKENLVVLGKSGSGKSVLIKCIVRLLMADSGKVNVLGNDVNVLSEKDLNELRKKIGFLFQSAALYDSMSVKQNLEFPLKRIQKDLSEKEVNSRVKEALDNVGLIEALNKMPSELSGGMRKRIGLARTIIINPVIMLYDEPTTGLDPITSAEISDLIINIRKKYHTSSIIITHDIACARATADRVMMLKDGEVFAEGSFKELERSKDEFINNFFK